PHCPALFPYTTLFRSIGPRADDQDVAPHGKSDDLKLHADLILRRPRMRAVRLAEHQPAALPADEIPVRHGHEAFHRSFRREPRRSEEHTSELQSRENL